MVLDEYQKQAVPWFAKLDSWDEIAKEYLRTNSIEESRLGAHTYEYGEDMRAATYGYLLLKAGDTENARIWLQEAERIKSLPLYTTRDGRTVHEKEKYARLQKPEDDEIESLNRVRTTLKKILDEA